MQSLFFRKTLRGLGNIVLKKHDFAHDDNEKIIEIF